MSHPKLDSVRQKCHYRCAYCGVTEVEAGGQLTVDHYQPVAAGGNDVDENLLYACIRCNQFKHDFWPGSDELARGWRVLHPLLEDLANHYSLNQPTGYLEPSTETGRFHIQLLRLNRPQLVEHRLSNQLHDILLEKIYLQQQQISELQKTIEAQEQYIAMLNQLLSSSS